MRKIAIFLVLLLTISVIFSCGFQLPKALEVHGNPDLTFSANKDIGEMLQGKLDSTEFELITCTNTNTRTYIFRQNILGDDFNLAEHKPDDMPLDLLDQGEIPKDIELFPSGFITIKIDFDEVLPDFKLKPAKARLYLYGSNLCNVIKVDIEGDDFNFSPFDFNTESVSFNNKIYTGTNLPGSKRGELTLTLSSEEQTMDFSVIIPKDSFVDIKWFDQPLKAELLIWLPLEFVASSDHAQIVFPNDFLFSDGDLFGREDPDDSNPIGDYVESLELSINLKQNAFKGRELIIWSQHGLKIPDLDKDIVIRHTLKGNAFVIPISSDTMEKINDPANYPFNPQFLFKYEENEELIIPREFISSEFVFKAKVKYRMEF